MNKFAGLKYRAIFVNLTNPTEIRFYEEIIYSVTYSGLHGVGRLAQLGAELLVGTIPAELAISAVNG